jgi:DNA (cytosine-5)-methyltransferase 1
MKVIDLFSGIGGFSLGLESTGGFETLQFVENNKWCQKVLAKNFPNVPITGDIRNYEGQEQADVVVGGFPCQPFSVAGKRKGTEDDRHLWPEMLRVIKASKPRWVIGENVRNLTSIQQGMVFEQVCTDLENEGYEVQSFIIPASAVNAPHQRYRVWIVAYSDSKLCRGWRAIEPSGENKDRELYSAQEEQAGKHLRSKTVRCNSVRGETENVADTNDTGDRTPKHETKREGKKIDKRWEGLSKSESSRLSKDVANSESSNRNDHETVKKPSKAKTQEVSGSSEDKRYNGVCC